MIDKKELFFDLVILGAGPAGFSAAIYAARGNLKTALIDTGMFGGRLLNCLKIENYPGFPLISGYELMEKFEAHADKFGVEKFPMVEIQKVILTSETKIIETTDMVFKSKSVIIAAGAQAKKLNIEGEEKFKGRGVSCCALCDGAFYKEKTVAVIGGGNCALEEAVYLTKFAKKVYIIHRRDELRADKICQNLAFGNKKIEFILCAVPVEIQGSNTVENLIIKDLKTMQNKTLKVDGVFPYIGSAPNSGMFNGQIKQTQAGFIETDVYMQTSAEGVFAAGDVRNAPLKQVITAASDGAAAACSAVKYIETKTPVII